MKKNQIKQKAFTLIELISVIILMGILFSVTGLGIEQIFKSYIITKSNSTVSLDSQIALLRIKKEFKMIESISSGDLTSLTYKSRFDKDTVINSSLEFSGSTITLTNPPSSDDHHTLIDHVTKFSLKYFNNYDSTTDTPWSASTQIIGIHMTIKGFDDTKFNYSTKIYLKNLH